MSETGTFTSAKNTTCKFSFIYFTDPQAIADAEYILSPRTTNAANNMFPYVNFWLCCGDLVNSSGEIK